LLGAGIATEDVTMFQMLEIMDMTYIQALVSADPSGDFESLLEGELSSARRAELGFKNPAEYNLTVFTFPNEQMSEVVAEVLMAMEDRSDTLSALRMMMRYHIIEGVRAHPVRRAVTHRCSGVL